MFYVFCPFTPLYRRFRLVSRMLKILMRSIDWYQKFLISRLAALYSPVFVFFIVKIDFLKLDLLSNRAVERFWDVLCAGLVRGSCALLLCAKMTGRPRPPDEMCVPSTTAFSTKIDENRRKSTKINENL